MKDYTVERGDLLIFISLRYRKPLSFHIGIVKGFEKKQGCSTNCRQVDNCGRSFETIIIKWEDQRYASTFCYNRKKGLNWLGNDKISSLIIIRNDTQKRFFSLFRKDV